MAERELQNDFNGQLQLRVELKETDEFRAVLLGDQIGQLRLQVGTFDSDNYGRPVESIQQDRYLGLLSNAIEVLIPATFNQEKFEEAIRQSEALKNTTSSNDGPVIEDVTDASEPTGN